MRELPTSETEFGLWPTPCATDTTDRQPPQRPHLTKNGTIRHIGVNGEQSQVRLSQVIKMWPTPNASDADKWSHQSLAERQAKGQQVRLNTAVAPEGARGGSLNPIWVEWLMGWPLGWTDLKPLETAKFQQWLDSHGKP
jgi:hypothetical protein